MSEKENAGTNGPFVSLYRRFRPGQFSGLFGQEHVVRALQRAVREDQVAHAYLFSGPRGTGKTSTARILARALNCANQKDGEPCGVCSSCLEIAKGTSLDVHELDAASNNGVDAMRDLVSHAALGTPGRWKVYIVDEVHMLSNAAANALLKTLEEPPSHVVFVLATTDPQKVPPTLRSRTQHLEFRLLGANTLTELLNEVVERAGLDLGAEDIAVVVRKARGSARDALSSLDQVVASGSADDERPELSEVLDAIANEDAQQVLVTLASLHEVGWGPQQLASELVDELRQGFLVALAPELAAASGAELARLQAFSDQVSLARLVRSIEVLGRVQVDMRDAPDPRVVLEVAMVRLCRAELDDSPEGLLERMTKLERLVGSGQVAPPAPASPAPAAAPVPPAEKPEKKPIDAGAQPTIGSLRKQRQAAAQAQPQPQPEPEHEAPSAAPAPSAASAPERQGSPPDRDTLVEAWGDHILRTLPARAKALYGAGHFVSMVGDRATFALPNEAHRDRCQDVVRVVEDAIGAHFGASVALDLVVDAPDDPAGALRSPSGTRPLETNGASDVADVVDDEYDRGEPAGEGQVESIAEARLREAFPGAESVGD